jgi:hypothetical protein
MANNVYVGDDGFLYNVYDGMVQTVETMQDVVHKNEELITQLRAKNLSVKLLIPYDTIGVVPQNARDLAIDSLKTLDYDKMAIYSSKASFSNYFWNLFILITGKGDKIRFFKTEDQAAAWLKM